MIGNIRTLMWRHCNNAISILQMITSPVRKCGCLIGSVNGLAPNRERRQQFIGSDNGLRLYWAHVITQTNKVLEFTDACIRRRFALVIFIRIFLKENDANILIWISLKFLPGCSVNNLPTLVDIMAWRLSGDKPLSKRGITKIIDTYINHWLNVVWTASSSYLNQFWVIAHYTPRNKSPWKWKLSQDISSSSPSAAYMRQKIG